MNVLYVSDSPTLSGAEVVLLQHLDHFTGQGHRASVFLRDTNTRLIAALHERGVPTIATPHFSRDVIETTADPSRLLGFVRAFRRAGRDMADLIAREHVNIVHSVSYPASLYAAIACRRTGVPQVWHEHNIKRIHLVNRQIYRFVASTCRWVIGPSDAVTTNLARAGLPAAKLRTVYNGIDLARFEAAGHGRPRVRAELGLADDTPAIALFGQMLPHKGHRTLLEALPAVVARFPGLRALLVGALENPPYEDELRREITARGLEGAVSFTGWRSDVHDVMSAMDAIVVATTTPEPAALALMEAMAVGRPIVATRTGGTAEIVADGDTGLLFAPGDAATLARHLEALIADPAYRDRLGRAGRARVTARFSQERHLAEIESLYRAACPGPRRSSTAEA